MLLGGLPLLTGQAVVAGSAPAWAEVPRLLDRSLHRYAKQLQRQADVLVFEARPLIQQSNWTGLSDLFKGDSYPNDVVQTVEFIVSGNEDSLLGAEEASVKLYAALQDMGSQLSTTAISQEKVVNAWEGIATGLNGVMAAANTLLAEEPELQDLPAFVFVPGYAGQYARSPADFVRRCSSLDGLFGGNVGTPCA